jgi:hypothetical protein
MIKTFKNKSEAAQAVLDLISSMESQSGYRAKILQTDNGGEYRSNEFISDLNKRRIALKETVPYYSETNPVAEWTSRTIMTIARTSIIQSGLPKKFWPEAVAHAVFTKNRIPHCALSEHLSPIEILKPDSNIINERLRFRSFGEPIWIYNLVVSLSHDKLSPRSEKGRIVTYSTGYKTYKACTERGSIVLTKDPKPKIIAQASPSIHISVPASEKCPDISAKINCALRCEES